MLEYVAKLSYRNKDEQRITFTETDSSYILTNLCTQKSIVIERDEVPISMQKWNPLAKDVKNRKNLFKVFEEINKNIDFIIEIDYTCMKYFIDTLINVYDNKKHKIDNFLYHLFLCTNLNDKSDISDYKVLMSIRWPIAEKKGEKYLKLYQEIENYFDREFDTFLSEDDFKNNVLNIYYTNYGDNDEYEVNIRLDLNDFTLKTYYQHFDNDELCVDVEEYENIENLIKLFEDLDTSNFSLDYIDEYKEMLNHLS